MDEQTIKDVLMLISEVTKMEETKTNPAMIESLARLVSAISY